MSNCKCECSFLSIAAGIIFGIIIGVLTYFGSFGAATAFGAYAVLGAAGILLAPVYGFLNSVSETERCFCSYKNILLASSAATLLSAAVGFIIVRIDLLIAIAITAGIATFFAVTLLGTLICLSRCIGCGR